MTVQECQWLSLPRNLPKLEDTPKRGSMVKKKSASWRGSSQERHRQSISPVYSTLKNHYLTSETIKSCHMIILHTVTLVWTWFATINKCCCEVNFWSEIRLFIAKKLSFTFLPLILKRSKSGCKWANWHEWRQPRVSVCSLLQPRVLFFKICGWKVYNFFAICYFLSRFHSYKKYWTINIWNESVVV